MNMSRATNLDVYLVKNMLRKIGDEIYMKWDSTIHTILGYTRIMCYKKKKKFFSINLLNYVLMFITIKHIIFVFIYNKNILSIQMSFFNKNIETYIKCVFLFRKYVSTMVFLGIYRILLPFARISVILLSGRQCRDGLSLTV